MSLGIGIQNITILFWKQRGCTVSFLEIHKWEPDNDIGFSPASSFAVQLEKRNSVWDYFNIRIVLCCSAADPEFYFKRLLKEQEKGLTARPLKLTVHLNQAGAKTRWLKNGNPMTVYSTRILTFNMCTIVIFCMNEIIAKWTNK
jgi:hypothetical protein